MCLALALSAKPSSLALALALALTLARVLALTFDGSELLLEFLQQRLLLLEVFLDDGALGVLLHVRECVRACVRA